MDIDNFMQEHVRIQYDRRVPELIVVDYAHFLGNCRDPDERIHVFCRTIWNRGAFSSFQTLEKGTELCSTFFRFIVSPSPFCCFGILMEKKSKKIPTLFSVWLPMFLLLIPYSHVARQP